MAEEIHPGGCGKCLEFLRHNRWGAGVFPLEQGHERRRARAASIAPEFEPMPHFFGQLGAFRDGHNYQVRINRFARGEGPEFGIF
jgi:hypothetical protein